jgi:hypothetical protein
MPMGIVSDKDFDSELSKVSDSPIKREESKSGIASTITAEIVDVTRGRPIGSVEVPNTLRKVIGETSITDGRQQAVDLAKQFGISPSSVSAYGVGATSTASYDETPNAGIINKTKDRISKRARNKLMLALKHITEDKLGETKARDLAGIAKDMSAVVKNMEPDSAKAPTSNGPTFVFYSPQLHKEEHYETVYAKE